MNYMILWGIRIKNYGLFMHMDSKEILALTAGRRSSKQLRELMKKLRHIEVENWCTDYWRSFSEVLPKDKHRVGKEFTKAIEGVNTFLRNSCRRLHRITTCFSKKIKKSLDSHKIGSKVFQQSIIFLNTQPFNNVY